MHKRRVMNPAICCRLIATGLALALVPFTGQAEDQAAKAQKPNRAERIAKKAAEGAASTAQRAGKFVEKTAKRSANWAERTTKKASQAVERAGEKTDAFIRRNLE